MVGTRWWMHPWEWNDRLATPNVVFNSTLTRIRSLKRIDALFSSGAKWERRLVACR